MAAAGCVLAGVAIFLSVLLYVRIQSDREAAIRFACMQRNENHDGAISALDKIISDIHDPARRRRAEQGRAQTVFFIEALAKKQDCDEVVRRQLHP